MTNLKKLPALSSLFAASIKAPAFIFVLLVALAVPSPANGEPETVPKTAPNEEKTKDVSVSRAYILKKLGLALLKCGRTSEALEKIDLAFSLDPYNSDPWQTRGLHIEQCEKPNATPIETKRRETEIDSNNYKLAKEFYDKNAYKQAIEYCNKELETPKTSKNPKTFRRTRVALKLRGLVT